MRNNKATIFHCRSSGKRMAIFKVPVLLFRSPSQAKTYLPKRKCHQKNIRTCQSQLRFAHSRQLCCPPENKLECPIFFLNTRCNHKIREVMLGDVFSRIMNSSHIVRNGATFLHGKTKQCCPGTIHGTEIQEFAAV